MKESAKHIIERLRKEIRPLEGFKPLKTEGEDLGLDMMGEAFPYGQFPLGAIHECLCPDAEGLTASTGFFLTVLSKLMKNKGLIVWISRQQELYAPGLLQYGIDPDRMLFIDCRKEKELLWVMEETLKCDGLAASLVILNEFDFTASRRLQLAVENSRVTGFIFRTRVKQISATACIARWQIKPLPSGQEPGLPGIGSTRWEVSLLKIRNGQPGKWNLEWQHNQLHEIQPEREEIMPEKNRKTG